MSRGQKVGRAKKLLMVLLSIAIVALAGGASWFLLSNFNKTSNVQTPPKPTPVVSFVDKQLANMSLRQKVSSLLILHTPGVDETTLKNYLQTYQPGGLIFMPDNITATLEQMSALTKQLQTNSSLPYLFAMDEEGGIVKRLGADNFPAAADLGLQPVSATQTAFHDRSVLLKQVGINLNFGIIADVTSDPDSFIYPRVFGGDPTAVSQRVAAAVTGANDLTLSTLKHFPGHGETEADSHTSIPVTSVSFAQWQTHDEPPFLSGIKAGAQVVMFGQLTYSSVDSVPATLSAKWHQILRQQDSFKGISITDDMIMLQQSGDPNYTDPVANAVESLNAGSTMLLYVLDNGTATSNVDPNTLIDGIVSAVQSGKLSQKLIDNDARQVLELRHNLPMTLNGS